MAEPQTRQSALVVVGERARPLRDLYHAALRLSWTEALLAIAGTWLVANALFALVYWIVGGVEGSDGGFVDAFFFSVETMGTIGYGEMHPVTAGAHTVVVVQSVVGLIVTAVATGMVFAKFSLPLSRIAFSKHVVISPMNGVPTMQLRVGNARSSIIAEATIRVAMVRTEKTHEGKTFYRLVDLPLARERSPALQRTWTVMHVIDEKSPLFGATPEQLVRDEVEIFVSVVGTDDTSLQPVHARHTYLTEDVLWGARHADILREREDGALVLDVRKFNDIEPTDRAPGFPYRHEPTKTG